MYLEFPFCSSLILIGLINIFLNHDMDYFYRSIGINKQSSRDFRAEIMTSIVLVIVIFTFFINMDLFNKMFILFIYIILGLIANRNSLNEKIVTKERSTDDNKCSYNSITTNILLGIWLLFVIYYSKLTFNGVTISEYELMILWNIYYIYEFILVTLIMFFPSQVINKVEQITGYNSKKEKEYEKIMKIYLALTFIIPFIISIIFLELL
ncbi:hypothetical protein [Methanosphaera sp. WGK6]|uniref:hypothetical protein n=1 Tax=Methanosphaera sp. WGK6 TaxID=1561964 RepID=UPI00084C3507|nr:hypothetical protein [Methanosphaera sp. WGK6]OED30913.1 hypothetical protein NL43_00980 [Methanosphaera sp. WGK6]